MKKREDGGSNGRKHEEGKAVVESGASVSVPVSDESMYDRHMRSNPYVNIIRAGRRWIYTVHAHISTEVDRAKGVRHLQHWCTHPLTAADREALRTDPHAFFTDMLRRDPSRAVFCDLALSMHSIAATEFSVERLFSLIHRVIGPSRSSLADDGIIALAKYNTQAQEEAKKYVSVIINMCFILFFMFLSGQRRSKI